MKRYFLAAAALAYVIGLVLIFRPTPTRADDRVEVYFFTDPSCYYCDTIHQALVELNQLYPAMLVNRFDITESELSATMLDDLFAVNGVANRSLPAVFVGNTVAIGGDAQAISEIESAVQACLANSCVSPSTQLEQYYNQLREDQQARHSLPRQLFWLGFLLVWPVVGVFAIIHIWRRQPARRLPPPAA